MFINEDDNKSRVSNSIPSKGFTTNAIPENKVSSKETNTQNGVSTKNVLTNSTIIRPQINRTVYENQEIHWYTLRATYGRERKAYEYIINNGGEAFYPTIKIIKFIDGKKRKIEESRLPNILFIHGSITELKKFVYDDPNLSFLRFYYGYYNDGNRRMRKPLIVPDNQIESLKIICASENDDIILVPENVTKFTEGELVKVTDGAFKGVIGRVARFCGQQRVAVVIKGIFTMATAYVPSRFLKRITD